MTELEISVKCHKEKHADKDQKIENLKTQLENQTKQNEKLNTQVENQTKKIEYLNTQVGSQTKQAKEINDKVEDQNRELENLLNKVDKESNEVQIQKRKIEELQQTININSMIIPNISDDINIYPAFSAFQWKFTVNEVRSSGKLLKSAPFYNNMNAMCFQLAAGFQENKFAIGLVRYRGKYDDAVNEITETHPFNITLHVFGQNGKRLVLNFCNTSYQFTIPHSTMSSGSRGKVINEISSLTIDGCVHIHCFFNNTTI